MQSLLGNKYKHIDNTYLYENSQKLYKLHLKIRKMLNKKQRNALLQYTSGSSRTINKMLRENKYNEMTIDELFDEMARHLQKKRDTQKLGKTCPDISSATLEQAFFDTINKTVTEGAQIDSIFKKMKDYQPFTLPLFRGIDVKTDLKPNKIGSIITFPDFLSTSINPGVAFAYQECGQNPCCILVLHVNDKIPYIPLAQTNNKIYNSKHEVLLPRATSWKIIKKYKTSIDINLAVTCKYKDVQKKITVYELKAMAYKYPDDVIEELDAKKYSNSQFIYKDTKKITHITQNKGFFKIKHNIPILGKK